MDSRRPKRWTQPELGKAAGLSRQAIAAILAGDSDPGDDTLQKLANALGVELPIFRLAADVRKGGTGGGAVREPDWRYDTAGPVESSGLETQLPDEEVIGLILHDRPGFIRYLQNQFANRALPIAAKIDRLDFIEEIAKERGIQLDSELFDSIRVLIQKRSL